MKNYNEIIQQLEKRIFHPVYVLMGEEPYFIDAISNHIAQNALNESEKGFNQTILYGKDSSADTVLTAARRFPMMAASQVVIVKEAQNLENLDEELLSYVENPMKTTVLVICYKYGTIDKRKKFIKAADQNGIVFESKKIYENKLMPWIQKYCSDKGYTIQPQAAVLLAEYLGTDIGKVVNELEKLMIVVPQTDTITPGHIEQNIGISKDYNVFELGNALGEKDVLKANKIINHFNANPKENPIQKTIGSLFYYFQKLLKIHLSPKKSRDDLQQILGVPPFFINDYLKAARNYPTKKLVEIVSLLREYDVKSKGVENVSTDATELQREMIFKILH
jgi:DNA polymerase-3 subunit delta